MSWRSLQPRGAAFLFVAFGLLASSAAVADEPQSTGDESGHKFIRLRRGDNDQLVAMETAITRYIPKDKAKQGLVVDLIGAVHIGEQSYYEQLNAQFEKYDAVLYELVAPEGTRVPKGGGDGGSAHPVNLLQQGMKNMLELEHQLEFIDYERDNFVHADMSPEDFSKSMADRGESIWTIVVKAMGASFAQQGQPGGISDADLILALFDANRALALKRVMAQQFEDLEGAMSIFEGPDGSTIISERNKKALAVLREQIDAGHTKIGIFYGAGHMPDMEKRLESDFDLVRRNERWLEAWNLRNDGEPAPDPEDEPAEEWTEEPTDAPEAEPADEPASDTEAELETVPPRAPGRNPKPR